MFESPCVAPPSDGTNPEPSSRIATSRSGAPPPDRDPGPSGACVLAGVPEPLLDDAEHLDLLVGCQAHRGVDVELHLELAVGGQEVDVSPECRVERRRPRGRRERESREAGLGLGCLRCLLELRDRLADVGAGLEHRRVRGDRKEVLGEAVVDLARHPRALLGDGAAELGGEHPAPHADHEDDVAE